MAAAKEALYPEKKLFAATKNRNLQGKSFF